MPWGRTELSELDLGAVSTDAVSAASVRSYEAQLAAKLDMAVIRRPAVIQSTNPFVQ